jgi:hypothetical protein
MVTSSAVTEYSGKRQKTRQIVGNAQQQRLNAIALLLAVYVAAL